MQTVFEGVRMRDSFQSDWNAAWMKVKSPYPISYHRKFCIHIFT